MSGIPRGDSSGVERSQSLAAKRKAAADAAAEKRKEAFSELQMKMKRHASHETNETTADDPPMRGAEPTTSTAAQSSPAPLSPPPPSPDPPAPSPPSPSQQSVEIIDVEVAEWRECD